MPHKQCRGLAALCSDNILLLTFNSFHPWEINHYCRKWLSK